MSILFESPRTFQLWRATVSHSQILFLSTKGDGLATRMELLFKSVLAANLLTWVKMQYVLRGNYSNVVVHYFRNLDIPGMDVEFKFK